VLQTIHDGDRDAPVQPQCMKVAWQRGEENWEQRRRAPKWADEVGQWQVKKKSKAVPVTGLGGLQGCEMLRIPHCLDNRLTDGGKVVSPTHRPSFTPETLLFLCCWYSFLLEAEYAPGA
jgi:hypothetical protein